MREPAALVDGVMTQGGLYALAGEYGTSKTFAALDLARAVATGGTWLGWPCQQGAVLFVEADSPGASLAPRLLAIEHEFPGFLHLPQVRFIVEACELVTAWAELAAWGQDVAKESGHPLRLIVLDSLLATLTAGTNPNDAAPGVAWVKAARQLGGATAPSPHEPGATVLALAHTGKDAQRGILGSVALPAGLDGVLALRSGDPIRVSTDRREGGKARDFAARASAYRLKESHGSCVVEVVQRDAASPRPLAPRGDAQRLLLDAAGSRARQRQGVVGRRSGHPDWPVLGRDALRDAWAAAMKAVNPNAQTTPTKFERALAALISAGWLGEEGDGVYLV